MGSSTSTTCYCYRLAMLAQVATMLLVALLFHPSMAFSPMIGTSPSSFPKNQHHHSGRTMCCVDTHGDRRRFSPSLMERSMIFKKKKDEDDEDLSFIETRDMTRDEMMQYNQQFEDTVNQEIIGMTVFSLIISLPLLYLAWVGFFAETAEIAGEL